jgi:TRAP-type C4-dicarboxylate transport system permease small subunit
VKTVQRLLAGAERLSMAGGYVASAALLAMTVGVSLDVIARFVFGAGSKAATELSGYLLVAIVFLGLAYTEKTKGHIEIHFVTARLSAATQRRLRLFRSFVFLAYTVALGYFGWRTVWTSYEFNSTSRTGLDVLIWPYQLFIPAGLALAMLLIAAKILAEIARPVSAGEASGAP